MFEILRPRKEYSALVFSCLLAIVSLECRFAAAAGRGDPPGNPLELVLQEMVGRHPQLLGLEVSVRQADGTWRSVAAAEGRDSPLAQCAPSIPARKKAPEQDPPFDGTLPLHDSGGRVIGVISVELPETCLKEPWARQVSEEIARQVQGRVSKQQDLQRLQLTARRRGERSVGLIVPAGVPLRVSVTRDVALRKGEAVLGELVEPVYVFDRAVIAKGTRVSGRVQRVEQTSKWKGVASGRLGSRKRAYLAFDTLILKDGTRLPLSTVVTQASGRVVELKSRSAGSDKKPGRQKASLARKAGGRVSGSIRKGKQQVKSLGKWGKVKGAIAARLPFRRAKIRAGSRVDAEVVEALDFGVAHCSRGELRRMGSHPPAGSVVQARLVTPLNSATVRVGTPVLAVVSRPLFDSTGHLILPEGTRLKGKVVQVRKARRLARNGRLNFSFFRIELPWGAIQPASSTLQGAAVAGSQHLELDSEGGVRVSKTKERYLAPAIAVTLASTASLDDDATQTGGAGVEGMGAAGGVLAVAWPAAAVPLGIYGAARSIYTHFFGRGRDVVFPKHTEMRIEFRPPASVALRKGHKASPE